MAVITVSRQMGTGAYKIASDVAKKLKYTFVDSACISECAAKYGITQELLHKIDDKPASYITAEDRKHAANLNIIETIVLDFARKGNAILYGRGSQDLLKGCENVLRLRFIAEFEERVERFAEREWIDPDLARSMIRRSDHQRGGFIHFYFDRDWDDPLSYDLIFNTSRLSPASIAEMIVVASKNQAFKDAEKDAIATIDNTMLMKKIEIALLSSTELVYRPFSIIAEKGKVFLKGHLVSEQEKKKAISIVKTVDGVVSVADDIQVVNYKAYRDKS